MIANSLVSLALLLGAGAGLRAAVPPEPRRPAAPRQVALSSVPALAVFQVDYDPDQVPTIYTKVRFATAIVFPETERVLQVVCGDKEWWQIDAPDRIVYLKPSRAGSSTNITVLGASGNIYEFYLQEISRDTNGLPVDPVAPEGLPLAPYARVNVHLGATTLRHLATQGPQYVAKTEFDAALQAADERVKAATEETQAIKRTAVKVVDQELTRIRTSYPAALQFNYNIQLGTRPFLVRAMFADDKFTYIKLDSDEAPAVYEIKDGKPNLVNFDYVNGVFVIRKVVDQGYLAVGKAKLNFSRTAEPAPPVPAKAQ